MARFGYLSTFPPTRCGLATFTDALSVAMQRPGDKSFIIRVVDEDNPDPAVTSGIPVVEQLRNGDPESVVAAARALNTAEVAVIQHEYGIYGGTDGDEVLDVLRRLEVPTVVVLHTVFNSPTPGQKAVLEEVVRLATRVVVMTETARGLLGRHYDTLGAVIDLIPHGVATFAPRAATASSGRPTILTWGLLGPGKGIERGIRAFAHLSDMAPKPLYRVLGQTHPKVLAHSGDAYRESLHALVNDLGLGDSVDIDGRYLSAEELAASVSAADAVLLPYDNSTQVTSGVLAEAVSAGKPVVATAFPHAVELLSDGAGLVVPHNDARAMSEALREILVGEQWAPSIPRPGAAANSEAAWPAVGERFRGIALKLRAAVAA